MAMDDQSMRPCIFDEANVVLNKPEGMTDEECVSLSIHTDGSICISKWVEHSWRKRVRFLFDGVIWLGVFSGSSQPPVYVRTDTPFEDSSEEPHEGAQ